MSCDGAAGGGAGRDVTVHVRAPDGTRLGLHRRGRGRPLVLVHGISADHTRWAPLVPLLAPAAAVHALDVRGRGLSGDTAPYDLGKEFADLAAVIDALATGPRTVDLLGHSSGAVCALEAARRTAGVRRVVAYEPPLLPPPIPQALLDRLADLLAAGRRTEVVETFLREVVRVPAEEIALLASAPAWPARVAAAHTLAREVAAYNAHRVGPAALAQVRAPVLVLVGELSPHFLRSSADEAVSRLPDARLAVLAGQGHMAVDTAPELVAAAVLRFLA